MLGSYLQIYHGPSAEGIIDAFRMLMRPQQLLLGTALMSSIVPAAITQSCELNPCSQLRKHTLQADALVISGLLHTRVMGKLEHRLSMGPLVSYRLRLGCVSRLQGALFPLL